MRGRERRQPQKPKGPNTVQLWRSSCWYKLPIVDLGYTNVTELIGFDKYPRSRLPKIATVDNDEKLQVLRQKYTGGIHYGTTKQSRQYCSNTTVQIRQVSQTRTLKGFTSKRKQLYSYTYSYLTKLQTLAKPVLSNRTVQLLNYTITATTDHESSTLKEDGTSLPTH